MITASLFTDMSSQMVYPLIPTFLAALGVTPALLGLIEGFAEGTASLFRTVFGRMSNKLQKRKIFIIFGYGLSDGIFRAHVVDIVEEENRATAFGILNTVIGLFLLPASVLMGLVWTQFSSQVAFIVAASKE